MLISLSLLVLQSGALQSTAPEDQQEPFGGVPDQSGEEDPTSFDGFRLGGDDEDFILKFRGKFDLDWAYFSADRDVEAVAGPFRNGVEFRRARFGFSGMLYGWIEFKSMYDFSDDTPGFRDLYMEFPDLLPIGSLRVGHFREPMGLEARTGSSSLTFMERATAFALTPGRNTGIMLYDRVLSKRATWAVGVFRATNSEGFGSDRGNGQEFAVTSRVTAAPVYAEKGRQLVHLGASFTLRNPNDGFVRIRSRPEAHLAPYIVDTGRVAAGRQMTGGLEGAVVLGPFSLQSEVLATSLDSGPGSSSVFHGYYVQASWFLTGDNRPYRRSTATFGRILPADPVKPGTGGIGSLELAVRYSYLDLIDGPVYGGAVDIGSVEFSWYLNAQFRLMVNYLVANLQSFGNEHTIQVRFHLDW